MMGRLLRLVISVLLLARSGFALVAAPDKRQQSAPLTTSITWTVTTTATATMSGTATVNTQLMGVRTQATATVEWPPPAVTVSVGTEVRFILVNEMPNNEKVTLHFHGILQDDGFAVMDGPEAITQCGVPPVLSQSKNTFVYRFVANKPGTYWIHSHDPGQYPKGLRTAFVVTDDTEKTFYGYEKDYTATVSDWYRNFSTAEEIYGKSDNPCGGGVEIIPDGVVFNDYVPSFSTTKNAPNTSSAYLVTAGSGNLTRFRLINMSAYSQFFISFEDHSVYIIEVDGVPLATAASMQTTKTDGFTLAAGQRVSVLLINHDIPDNGIYRIFAALDPRMGPANTGDNRCHVPNFTSRITLYTYGCFSYSSATDQCTAPNPTNITMLKFRSSRDAGAIPKNEPRKELTLDVPWVDYLHTPYAYPWNVEKNFNERLFVPRDSSFGRDAMMNISPGNAHWLYITAGTGTGFGSFDDALWKNDVQGPSDVGLLRALDSTLTDPAFNSPASYSSPRSRASNTIVVKNKGDVVWLMFETGVGDHPIHLHGHHFQLLYKGFEDSNSLRQYKQAVSDFTSCDTAANPISCAAGKPTWTDFKAAVKTVTPVTPMRRDTLQAEKFQFMIVAFVADNPGVWALHCHNDFHAASGMTRQVVAAPVAMREALGTYNLMTGAQVTAGSGLSTKYQTLRTNAIVRNINQCLGNDMTPWINM